MDTFFLQTFGPNLDDTSKGILKRWQEHLPPDSMIQVFFKKVPKKTHSPYKYLHGHVIPMITAFLWKKGICRIITKAGNVVPIDTESFYDILMVEKFYNYVDINGTLYRTPGKARKMDNAEMNILIDEIVYEYSERYHIPFLTRDEFIEAMTTGSQSTSEIVEGLIGTGGRQG